MTLNIIKVKLKSKIKCHNCLLYTIKLGVVEEVFSDLCHIAHSRCKLICTERAEQFYSDRRTYR